MALHVVCLVISWLLLGDGSGVLGQQKYFIMC